jgi:hypothetical protein
MGDARSELRNSRACFGQTAGGTQNSGPQGTGNFVAGKPEGHGNFVAGKPRKATPKH